MEHWRTEIALESLIECCRKEQIMFHLGESDVSGLDTLRKSLEEEIITLELYFKIFPAVIDPYAEYEVKITK